MSYARKVIGQDENLVGIARLHWIYVLQGTLWFLGFAISANLLQSGIYNLLTLLPPMPESGMAPLITLENWLSPLALICGLIVFSLYVIKVLTTEIALTSRRVIHKWGWLFVNIKEIDIEEIRGEHMDMGYLGRVLNYAYINLDCRFIGDVNLPAIEKPTAFLKALHKMRTEVTDTVSLVVDDKTIAMVNGATKAPPSLKRDTPELQKDEHLDQSEVIAKAVTEALQRIPATTTPAQPAAPAMVDPVTVAAIVEQVVPTMVERVAEKVTEKVTEKVQQEIEAKGILPIPEGTEILDEETEAPAPHPMADESRLEPEGPDEELLQSFDEAATAANENKPHPDEPKQIIR